MDNKMILGTVQLGINYGINNTLGKPSDQVAYDILDYAYKNGIRYLDTASAYGDSERMIGNYIRKTGNVYKICTKLPVDIENKNVNQYYEKSISDLGIKKIDVLYLHRFEQCRNKDIMEELQMLKHNGKISNIGVSIYEPEELKYIIKNLEGFVDVVQLPFNLFDSCRWIDNGLLEKVKENGIKIYVRSVYLQGLFFLEPESEKAQNLNVSNQLMQLRTLAKRNKCSIAELAVGYIKSFAYIDNYLIGCESIEQLRTNISINNINIDDKIKDEILNIAKTVDDVTIDPRRWKK